MKVLHINQSDIGGGAAIAGYRLHQGLLNQGIDSKLLVGTVKTDSPSVCAAPRRSNLERLQFHVISRLGLNHVLNLGSFDIPQHPFYETADILNLHNLHGGYFSYLALPALTQTKPAVFTLHDMWSFTGHCAYSYDCSKWQTGCGDCPYPDTYPAIARDTSHWEWRLKDWIYNRAHLTVVAPSHWLANQARKSQLNRFTIHHIPYGIDTSAYQPLDPELSRRVLGISPDQRVIMFGATSLKDTRKGGDILLQALQTLPVALKKEICLLILGEGEEAITRKVDIPTFSMGYVNNDRLKSMAYSAADLFVFPTRADNLPLMLQESLACGTPMVSFDVGGVPDLVRHGITGYLAQLEDTIGLQQSIMQLLEDQATRDKMSENCRRIAISEYNSDVIANRYIDLYKSILTK